MEGLLWQSVGYAVESGVLGIGCRGCPSICRERGLCAPVDRCCSVIVGSELLGWGVM